MTTRVFSYVAITKLFVLDPNTRAKGPGKHMDDHALAPSVDTGHEEEHNFLKRNTNTGITHWLQGWIIPGRELER